jgi:uncharacterized repeat protein (TIGR03803 family)
MLKFRSLSRSARALLFSLAAMMLLAGLGGASTTTTIHTFSGGTDGANPLGGVAFDAAGNLYGTTQGGGTGSYCSNGCGTVFHLSLVSGVWTESVIYNFQGSGTYDGSQPAGPLTIDASGNLYGYTLYGGKTNNGIIYELSPAQNGAWTETIVHQFGTSPHDGGFTAGKLIFDSTGNLWGVNEVGGKNGGGTVFELSPSSSGWQYSLIYSFPHGATLEGTEPSGILFDNQGNLYGVTTFGGIDCCNGAGVVFQLVNSGGVWTQKVLHRFPVFNTKRLQTPTGGLFLDSTGTLYMTMARGGNGNTGVTTIDLTTLATNDLYSFQGPQIIEPYQAIEFDSTGNLYSASYYSNTENGGTCYSTCGFVFELSPASPHWISHILESYSGENGINPPGGVVFDNAGNLYGVTTYGGANSLGVVFEITP